MLPDVARRASTRMNGEMTERVLRAPLAFFHTNPSGRILNRCSAAHSAFTWPHAHAINSMESQQC